MSRSVCYEVYLLTAGAGLNSQTSICTWNLHRRSASKSLKRSFMFFFLFFKVSRPSDQSCLQQQRCFFLRLASKSLNASFGCMILLKCLVPTETLRQWKCRLRSRRAAESRKEDMLFVCFLFYWKCQSCCGNPPWDFISNVALISVSVWI